MCDLEAIFHQVKVNVQDGNVDSDPVEYKVRLFTLWCLTLILKYENPL